MPGRARHAADRAAGRHRPAWTADDGRARHPRDRPRARPAGAPAGRRSAPARPPRRTWATASCPPAGCSSGRSRSASAPTRTRSSTRSSSCARSRPARAAQAERRNVLVPAGADGPTGYLLEIGTATAPARSGSTGRSGRWRSTSTPRRCAGSTAADVPGRADLRRHRGRAPPGLNRKGTRWTSRSRPSSCELRARTRALVDDVLQPLELEAESNARPAAAPRRTRGSSRAVLDAGLNAANIPTEYGGGGLDLTAADRHARAARPADQLPVGAGLEPVQRARARHARADRALPAARRARRAPPRLRDHRGGRRLRSRARSAPRRSATATSTGCPASSGSSPTATSPATSWCWRGRWTATSGSRRCSSSTRTCPASR